MNIKKFMDERYKSSPNYCYICENWSEDPSGIIHEEKGIKTIKWLCDNCFTIKVGDK